MLGRTTVQPKPFNVALRQKKKLNDVISVLTLDSIADSFRGFLISKRKDSHQWKEKARTAI